MRQTKRLYFILPILFSFIIGENVELIPIEIGVDSIYRRNENITIDVYAFNYIPIAGIQLEANFQDYFSIDSVLGGRCAENNFTMYSNSKGTILAFSMKGNLIPISKDSDKKNNLIFSIQGKINTSKSNPLDSLVFNSIIAGKKGKKLDSKVIPYKWNMAH